MTSARTELLALAWAKTKAAWDPETHSGIDPGEAVEQAAVELLEAKAPAPRLSRWREAVSETDLPPTTSSADAIRQLWDRLLDAEAAAIASDSEARAARIDSLLGDSIRRELGPEHTGTEDCDLWLAVQELRETAGSADAEAMADTPLAVAVFSAPIGEAVTGEQYFEARDSHVLVRSDSTVEGVAASWREQFGGDSVHEGLRATDEPKTPNAPGWWWRMHGDNLEHATPVLVSATLGYGGATLGFRWRNDEGYTTSVDGSHWGGRIMRPGSP